MMPSTRRLLSRDGRLSAAWRAVIADTLADAEGLWHESRLAARPSALLTTHDRPAPPGRRRPAAGRRGVPERARSS